MGGVQTHLPRPDSLLGLTVAADAVQARADPRRHHPKYRFETYPAHLGAADSASWRVRDPSTVPTYPGWSQRAWTKRMQPNPSVIEGEVYSKRHRGKGKKERK